MAKERIVIADDDDFMREGLLETLAGPRYRVDGHPTAEAALAALTDAPASPPPMSNAAMRRSGGGKIWIVGADGTPEPVRVRQKLADGTFVEIETEQNIEGREVIMGINTATSATTAADNNPFAPKMPGPQMRRAVR